MEFGSDGSDNDGDGEADWSLEEVVEFGDGVSDIPVVDCNVAFVEFETFVGDGVVAFVEFETFVGDGVVAFEFPATALN